MSTGVKRKVAAERVVPSQWTLTDGLELVEERLSELLHSAEPLLTEISSYLVLSGGKRVRPAVTLLIFRACGGQSARDIVDVATALELIHSATLLHDDIIDESDTRRGQMSSLRKYGVARTLVTGDFVFSRAFQLCSRFEEKLINWAAEACVSLTEGEIMQGRFRFNPAVTLADYLEIIGRKTASIFRQGARTAAYLAAAPESVVQAMGDCGFSVGMTFQIVDDLLDIDGDERTGKPVGIDLRDGNPSLPIVLAMQRDASIAPMFARTDLSDAEIATLQERIHKSGVVPEVRRMAADYGKQARANLRSLPPSEDRDQLLGMIEQLLSRAQ